MNDNTDNERDTAIDAYIKDHDLRIGCVYKISECYIASLSIKDVRRNCSGMLIKIIPELDICILSLISNTLSHGRLIIANVEHLKPHFDE